MLSTSQHHGGRSAGRTRIFHLKTEIDIFLMEKAVPQYPGKEGDMALAFVANRTTHLNEVNIKQQGK